MSDLGSTDNKLTEVNTSQAPEENEERPTVEILILEDDPESGQFYQMKLAHPTRTIFVAATMGSAVRILDEHDITLILLDLTLPDADGRSFLRHVRENPRTSTVPIIVVSGRHGDGKQN